MTYVKTGAAAGPMSPNLTAFAALAGAIVCEVAGTTMLQLSQQFTRVVPTVMMGVLYVASLYFLSQVLKAIPLGIAYAIWGGLGIVLTAIVGMVLFRQALDAAALLGIAMIVGGIVVINLFSRTAGH